MTASELTANRLAAQQIAHPVSTSAKELVRHMGVMQAQDYAMSLWAVGVRQPTITAADVQAAVDRGEIIRTHVLRPTWHLVSPDDVYWMTEFSARRILSSFKARHRDLGLTEEVFKRGNRTIEQALSRGEHLTRNALVAALEANGIPNEDNRASHLLMRAELDGISCSGKSVGGKPTYALLAERVPKRRALTKEEALAALAKRYFTGHGPATIMDFVWWSGLSITAAKAGLESVKSMLELATDGARQYWFTATVSPPLPSPSVYLLPAYDEYIIGYTDRSAAVADDHFKKVVMTNGLFRATVVVDGKVVGSWKRTVDKDSVTIAVNFFYPQNEHLKALVSQKALGFGNFLGKRVNVVFADA